MPSMVAATAAAAASAGMTINDGPTDDQLFEEDDASLVYDSDSSPDNEESESTPKK